MADEWRRHRFSELCDITRGGSPRPIHEWIAPTGIPWVKIADASSSNSRFIERTNEFINPEGRSKSRSVVPGDLILSNSASPGMPMFMAIDACIHDGWLLLRNFRGIDKLFCYYLLLFERDRIVRQGTGTVFINLKTEILKNHEVAIPSLTQQKAIARILGTLDDKIELNRRMNETLEAIARAIFKSWFADFDPVRSKADGMRPVGMDTETAALFPDSLMDSPLGKIPRGWQVKSLQDACEIEIGGDWGEESDFDGSVEVACLRGVDLEHLREAGRAKVPRRWVKQGSLQKRAMTDYDVLVAASGVGPLGRPLWVSPSLREAFDVPVTYSNFCKRLHCISPEYATFLDRVLLNMRVDGEVWEYANGTSIPNLDIKGLLAGKLVAFPPDSLISRLHTLLSYVYEKLYSRESRTLGEIRDALLPKLISGEIRVKDVEKFVEEHAS